MINGPLPVKLRWWSQAVRTCYALTGVPLCCLGVVYALELEQRGTGVGVALSSDCERWFMGVQCPNRRTLAGSCRVVSIAIC